MKNKKRTQMGSFFTLSVCFADTSPEGRGTRTLRVYTSSVKCPTSFGHRSSVILSEAKNLTSGSLKDDNGHLPPSPTGRQDNVAKLPPRFCRACATAPCGFDFGLRPPLRMTRANEKGFQRGKRLKICLRKFSSVVPLAWFFCNFS